MARRHQPSSATGRARFSPSPAGTTAQLVTEPVAPDQTREAKRSAGAWRGVYVLIPTALAVFTSINTLWNDFASDDLQMVLSNALIKNLGNLPRAFMVSGWAFSSNDIKFAADAFYRPMLNVLFTINYALFGTAPWGWHLANVLIHAAVTLLVFLVLNEFTGRRWLALTAATFFAVHPVHAESVAWVSGVTDPLFALFVLSAFYCYLKYRRTETKYLIAAAGLFYLLALLVKETAVAMPLIVAYCELAHFNQTEVLRKRIIRGAKLLCLFAIPFAVYFFLRYVALGTPTLSGEAMNPLDYAIRTVPLAVVKYLKLILVPFGYSFQHYTLLVGSLTSLAFVGPVLIIAVIAAAVWVSRSRLLFFATAWFLIWLAPSLAVLRQYEPQSLVQERYLYLPSVGFCLALALGIEWLARRKRLGMPGQRVAFGIVLVIVVFWSVVLVRQNVTWHDSITLYENSVAVDPNSPAARSALGMAYSEAGRFREADEQSRLALQLDSQHLDSYLVLGYRADRLGQTDQAIKYLQDAVSTVREGPLNRLKLATVYLNLGRLYEQQKKYDVAEQNLLRSVEMWPRPVGWYYTGLNYYYQERYDQALAMYEQVIRHVPPNYAPIHLSIGAVYESLNRIDEARAEYYKYLELSPPEVPDRQLVEQKLRRLQVNPNTK